MKEHSMTRRISSNSDRITNVNSELQLPQPLFNDGLYEIHSDSCDLPLKQIEVPSSSAGRKKIPHTQTSLHSILSQEPIFKEGIPKSGFWTCSLCFFHFSLFKVSIGCHLYSCIESKYKIVIRNELLKYEDEENKKLEERKGRHESTILPVREHNKTHSRSRSLCSTSKHQCRHCRKWLFSKASLERHIVIHVSQLQNTFQCPKCKKKLGNKNKLQIHLEKCNQPKSKIGLITFFCRICPLIFSSRYKLEKHFKESHSGVQLQCHFCKCKFASPIDFHQHMETHPSEIQELRCIKCGKYLSSKYSLTGHVRKCIIFNLKNINENKCQICTKEFASKFTLRTHYQTHFPHLEIKGPLPKCTECKKVFSTKKGLSNHSKVCLPAKVDSVKVKGRLFKCKICFKKVSNLPRHMLVHSKKRQILCSQCPAKFHRKEDLKIHMKTHNLSKSKIKPQKISEKVCQLPALVNSKRRYHSVITSLNAPKKNIKEKIKNSFKKIYVTMKKKKNCYSTSACKICHKEVRSIRMQVHMRLHSGKTPFYCSKCDTAYATPVALNRHLAKHRVAKHLPVSGHPPFMCRYCNATFTFKSNMFRHVTNLHSKISAVKTSCKLEKNIVTSK